MSARKIVATLALGVAVLFVATPASAVGNLAEAAVCKDFGVYDSLLRFYVRDGQVAYGQLLGASDREQLGAAVDRLQQCTVSGIVELTFAEQMAYWINAYNLLTIKLVVDHYPIQASSLRSLKYPKNSIRQIPGIWSDFRFKLAGRNVTLDDIEHKILRKEFREPRIHFAVNCASAGCPVLRGEAYSGEILEAQLDDQTRLFVADPQHGIYTDWSHNVLRLSPILDWFGEDFEKAVPATAEIPQPRAGLGGYQLAIVRFLAKYASEPQRDFLLQRSYTVEYSDYDWTLNELRSE